MIETFTIVGGASAYTPGLVKALIHQSERVDLEEVRLFDIDAERLAIVAELCAKMAEQSGCGFRVRSATDKRAAVEGVDALLNSSRPGGFECRKIDETLPLEFEIPGQETVGPGGFFFALRSIPEALDLADHVAEYAPEATWLNYTNPTNIVGQALADRTDLDLLTLCDQSDEDLEAICDAIGRPGASYDFTCVGLNHATWYDDVTIDGEPLPPAAYEAEPPDYFDEEHTIRFRLSQQLADEHDGRWPNSYLPYYTAPGRFVDLSRRSGPRTETILENIDDYYAHFTREASKSKPDLRHHRGSDGFGDMAVDVLAALGSDEPRELVLNVPNRGMTDAFDDATLVEARVELSSEGVSRRECPAIPDGEAPRLEQLEHYQRKTARAAVIGDDSALVDALAANPLVGAETVAERLLERARTVYGDAIPAFR